MSQIDPQTTNPDLPEEVPYCGFCLYEGVECRYPECIKELQEAMKDEQ